jgi:chemotaxis protein histidine kinase CheA/CheY-like chemotaxis protein
MDLDKDLLRLIVRTFGTEGQEICTSITSQMLALEKLPAGDPAAGPAMREISRMLHTLKGSAATAGLDDLASIAHALEDLVAPLKVRPDRAPEATDCLLSTIDVFQERLRAHVDEQSASLPSPDPLIQQVRARAAAFAAAPAPAPAPPSSVPAPTAPASPSVAAAPPTAPASSPAPASAPADAPHPTPGPGAPSASPSDPAHEAQRASDSASGDQSAWRVDAQQVLSLMKQVDRLREVSLRLAERRRELRTVDVRQTAQASLLLGGKHRAATLESIASAASIDSDETGDIVASLEEGIKAICTVPIRTIIDPLHRTVRDVARACGKEVRLSALGTELAFDRRALEALRGPLLHLVRNAVDHGIELPEARSQSGKARMGLIAIRVERQGNMAFLEVEDDGAGLDLDRIRAVAQERSLFTSEALDAMNPLQLQQLVFHSGFSTRAQVNSISGRGVGLDVVKSALVKLHGQVEIQSRAGRGCKFVLSLPVELGSTPALLVRSLDETLGLPMLAIESVTSVRRDYLHRVRNEMRLPFRDTLIPLSDLAALLGLREGTVPAEGQPAVVLGYRGQYAALAVDEVIGDRELPVRGLPAELSGLVAYQGASVLSRGDLVLMLDAAWLVDPLRSKESRPAASGSAVMVVDDSLTARALHRSTLEAGGYQVHAVSSATQALEALDRGSYMAMVSDIGMDGIDGIELTAQLRARADTRQLPIILVSGREGLDDRQRGLEAGADGYLTKSECAQGRLLRELQTVLRARSGA